jgi:hypothetical protein
MSQCGREKRLSLINGDHPTRLFSMMPAGALHILGNALYKHIG